MPGRATARLFGAALAIAVVAVGLVAPGAQAAEFDIVTRTYIVETRDANIYLEVAHPAEGDKVITGPVILTYSPYSVLGRNTDADEWVPQGYVRAQADVIGTGNSGGCWDYGGNLEKRTAYDLIEWIAKQKWSTGKVAMMGGSYEGTTATAAAVTKPPHLTTIVPEAAISRWYGYAFAGGIRYALNNEWLGHQGPGAITDEGLDTPLAFDFGLAIPPPLDPQDPNWADRVASTITPCDEIEHAEHGYDQTPNYDKFWRERDYVKDAGKIKIPVLVAHNWGDWNVKQDEGWNLFNALKRSKNAVMFFGTRWEGHGTPPMQKFDKTVHDWMDHYLMGKDTGADRLPSVITQTSDSEGAGKLFFGAPKTKDIELIAQQTPRTEPGAYQWMLLPTKPRELFGPAANANDASFPITNANDESHAAHHGRFNHEWFWLETPVFKKDTRIFGEIKVQIYSTIEREWVTFTPSIIDVDPADHLVVSGQHVGATDPKAVVGITRGFLDTRYRDSLKKQKPVKAGRPFEVTVVAHPQDYVFKKGHYIGLNIQTEILEWMLPKPNPDCSAVPDPNAETGCAFIRIHTDEARTRLILPVVDAPKNPLDLFILGHVHN